MKRCYPIRTEKTEGYSERMRRGAELAKALPQLMTQAEVAQTMGISQQAVCNIERRALAKIREALVVEAEKMRPR